MPRPRGLNRHGLKLRKMLALGLLYDGVPAPQAARLACMDVRTVRQIAALLVREAA